MRPDGRSNDQMRSVQIEPNFLKKPPGSCLIQVGGTRIVCSAVMEESVPPWLKGSGRGWLSAEYSMLPGSCDERVRRERSKVGGRTQEIQRLIGRSLRSCLDLAKLGERSLVVDCDVLDADGGTRTASITGGYVALSLALQNLEPSVPGISKALHCGVAAVSVGLVEGVEVLDLNYQEDKHADVDMNVVRISSGKYIELQGTAESTPFDRSQLDKLLALADSGIDGLFSEQQKALGK